MDLIADTMNLQSIEVFEVASFYSMFNLRRLANVNWKFAAHHHAGLEVQKILARLHRQEIKHHDGETTSDGMFTLKAVECLGSCGSAPMLQCGAEYHENLTEAKIDVLLKGIMYRGKRKNYTDLDYTNTK